MKASLRALLSGVIDYAGLFPPAKLPLEEAIRNYARYRTEPESWMLGRFICPANRLEELVPPRAGLDAGTVATPWVFSVLSRGGKSLEELQSALVADFADINAFRSACGAAVRIDALELRLPAAVEWEALDQLHTRPLFMPLFILAAGLVKDQGPPPFTAWLEAELAGDWHGPLKKLIDMLAEVNRDGDRVGFKLRCGGTDAAAFPTSEQVAFIITACRDANVPLKFTAGLHHPIRHFDPGMQVHMHGFLNVLIAAVLARARQLDEERVRQIVAEEDPECFGFEENTITWEDCWVGENQIKTARRYGVISFGSCSFDEPRDDLRALGLL